MNDPMYDWHDRAVCRNLPVETFYLPEGSGTADRQIKNLCRTCPVRMHCAIAGLAEDHGHWGGAAPDTRNKWRKQLRMNVILPKTGPLESRYQRYQPWLQKVFADARRIGVKNAFVSNSADPARARAWLRDMELT